MQIFDDLDYGVQSFFLEAGDAACYAIALVKIASRFLTKPLPLLASLKAGIKNKFIAYDEEDLSNPDNFFVKDPAGFLKYLTGLNWDVRKESAAYAPREGEYVVERWERSRVGSTTGHFRLPDWDSLVDSQTVKYGKIASTRVCSVLDA